MVRLVTIDGKDLGVLLQSKPDQYGNVNTITVKNEWLERYYVNDLKRGTQLLQRLLNEAQKDPDSRKVFVALVRKLYQQTAIPPQSILNTSAKNPDVFILLMDEKGRPVPLDALISNSQEERDRLSKLFSYYNTFVHYVYPKLVRELDLYKQTVAHYQLLLNTRDHEVNTLLESNARALQVMKNLQSLAYTLEARITMLEQLLELSSNEADKWRETSSKVISEVLPEISDLVVRFTQELAQGVTTTMQYHASELSRSEAVRRTVNDLLTRIKEIEKEYMKAVSEATREIKKPPEFKLEGGGEVGGEEGGEETGGEESE